jgi:hypothetical protein
MDGSLLSSSYHQWKKRQELKYPAPKVNMDQISNTGSPEMSAISIPFV